MAAKGSVKLHRLHTEFLEFPQLSGLMVARDGCVNFKPYFLLAMGSSDKGYSGMLMGKGPIICSWSGLALGCAQGCMTCLGKGRTVKLAGMVLIALMAWRVVRGTPQACIALYATLHVMMPTLCAFAEMAPSLCSILLSACCTSCSCFLLLYMATLL